MREYKLSLSAAVLINLNIMVGVGVFVNTVLLSQNLGALSPFLYVITGVVLLPLVISFSLLLNISGGSFYDFGAIISPFWGFVLAFSYFFAKLASAALCIHVFVLFFQQLVPFFLRFSPLLLSFFIISLFVLLNMSNIRTGERIQYAFLLLKLVPIFLVIFGGLILFSPQNFDFSNVFVPSFVSNIPFALYSFTGFAACCSIGAHIENPKKNAPRAILISYLLGFVIIVSYQLFFYGAFGDVLWFFKGYLDIFPLFLSRLLSNFTYLRKTLLFLATVGVASSSLGAVYGIMYSNIWNFFRLAEIGSLPFSSYLTSRNRNNIPFLIVLFEGFILLLFLLITQGNQVPLQQFNSLGLTLTFLFSIISLFYYGLKFRKKWIFVPVLGFLSCSLLLAGLVRGFIFYGVIPFLLFVLILCLGISSFLLYFRHPQRS